MTTKKKRNEYRGESAAALARKNAGAVDPETAEVCCFYEEEDDPYGVIRMNWAMSPRGEVPLYYARVPGSDIWVWFGDLPEPVRAALWEKHKEKLQEV
jgi:hypothetical protein